MQHIGTTEAHLREVFEQIFDAKNRKLAGWYPNKSGDLVLLTGNPTNVNYRNERLSLFSIPLNANVAAVAAQAWIQPQLLNDQYFWRVLEFAYPHPEIVGVIQIVQQ